MASCWVGMDQGAHQLAGGIHAFHLSESHVILTSPLLSTSHLHPPTYQPPIKLFSSFTAFCSKYILIKIEFLPSCFSLQTFPLDTV